LGPFPIKPALWKRDTMSCVVRPYFAATSLMRWWRHRFHNSSTVGGLITGIGHTPKRKQLRTSRGTENVEFRQQRGNVRTVAGQRRPHTLVLLLIEAHLVGRADH